MRVSWLVLGLAVASLVSGCAAGGATYWPAGTEAVVSPPKAQRILVRIPADQKEDAGGRNWVTIDSGTRVVCVEDLEYKAIRAGQTNPYPTADVRVQVVEGKHEGLEVLIPRGVLSARVEPPPPNLGTALLLFGLAILVIFAVRLIAIAAGVLRRRRKVDRLWIEAHPGESLSDLTRPHRPEDFVPSARSEGQAEWAEWLASRNSRSRNRKPDPVSCADEWM